MSAWEPVFIDCSMLVSERFSLNSLNLHTEKYSFSRHWYSSLLRTAEQTGEGRDESPSGRSLRVSSGMVLCQPLATARWVHSGLEVRTAAWWQCSLHPENSPSVLWKLLLSKSPPNAGFHSVDKLNYKRGKGCFQKQSWNSVFPQLMSWQKITCFNLFCQSFVSLSSGCRVLLGPEQRRI